MKSVFLVFAQHQLRQVEIAIDYFQLELENVIIIVLVEITEQDEKRFEKNIVFASNWTFKESIYKSRRYISILRKLKKAHSKIDLYTPQYLTDASLLANSILKPTTFYLVDEGTANFLFSYIREKSQENKKRIFLKSLVYLIELRIPKSIVYFTKYDFEINKRNDKVIKYKEVIRRDHIKHLDRNSVIYLGSSIVELGMVKEDNYLRFLKKVIEIFKGKKVIYACHRKETSRKISKISNLGFIIMMNDIGFEKWYEEQEHISYYICSHYYATVLGNLCDLYKKKAELICFYSTLLTPLFDVVVCDKILQHNATKEAIKMIELE